MRRRAWWVLPIACLGCAPAPAAPSAAAPVPPAATAPSAAPTVASVASGLQPSPGPREPATFSFEVAVQGDAPLEIVAGPGGALVLTASHVVEVTDGASRVTTEPYGPYRTGGGMVSDRLFAAGGAWPDAVFLSSVEIDMGGRVGCPSDLFRWESHEWSRVATHSEVGFINPGFAATFGTGLVFSALSPWTPGTALAVASANACGSIAMGGRGGIVFTPIGAPPGRAVPRPAPTLHPHPDDNAHMEQKACRTRMGSTTSLSALPTGEVFVLGEECETGDASVESWAAGATDGRYDRLPAAAAGPMNVAAIAIDHDGLVPLAGSIVARAPGDVTVGGSRAGHAYLAHFDGATWTALDPPMRAAITSMAGAPGASLWATTADGELWRSPPGQPWQRVDLGARKARRVRVGDPGDVWVLADGAALRSRPSHAVSLDALSARDGSTRPPAPAADASCSTLFVQLASPGPDATGDSDYPRIRAALAGHRELEGSRFIIADQELGAFGAVVRDLETARRLADLVHAALPTVHPLVRCHTPVVFRTLRFDLATGAMEGCDAPFVQLFSAPERPAGYDFPATRALLAGHPGWAGSRLVVHGTAVGVIARDQAVAGQIASVFRAGMKGARPEVQCQQPEGAEEIRIDWGTGKVVK